MVREIPIRLTVKDAEIAKKALINFGNDGARALKKIEKAGKPVNKGLLAVDAVSKDVRGSFASTAAGAGALGAGLTALGPVGIAAAAGLAVATIGATKFYNAILPAVDAVAQVKDQASFAGVAAEGWQELAFAANEAQVTQDALADGLKETNIRVDEFVQTGKGPAAEALTRLGYTQDELADKLKNVDDLFVDVIRRMQGFDKAAQIRIADEIFGGTAGEQFVRFLEKGADEIERMRQEARDLGLVFDNDVIERADETRDKVKLLSQVIDANLNSAIVHAGPLVVGFTETFADLAKWVGEVVDGFVAIENKSLSGLQREIDELADRQKELTTELSKDLRFSFTPRHVLEGELREVEQELFNLYQEKTNREIEINARQNPRPVSAGDGGGAAEGTDQAKDVIKELDNKLLQFKLSKEAFERVTTLDRAGVKPDSEQGIAITNKINQIQQLRQQQSELNAMEQAYLDLERDVADTLAQSEAAVEQRNQSYSDYIAALQQSVKEQRLALQGKDNEVELLRAEEALRQRLGGVLLPEEAQAVRDLVAERQKLDAALDKNQKASQELNSLGDQIGDRFASAFEDAIFAAEDFGDVMNALLKDLASSILRSALLEPLGGAIGGFFTSLFPFENGGVMTSAGPLPLRAYENGGIANSPQLALYGEGKKPEAYVPLPDGRTIPVTLKGGQSPGSMLVQFHNQITVEGGRGGEDENREAAAEMVKYMERQLTAIIDGRILHQSRLGGSLKPMRKI